MNKAFLDAMYASLSVHKARLVELLKYADGPHSGCNHCNQTSGDIHRLQIANEEQFVSEINSTIEVYLKIHA